MAYYRDDLLRVTFYRINGTKHGTEPMDARKTFSC